MKALVCVDLHFALIEVVAETPFFLFCGSAPIIRSALATIRNIATPFTDPTRPNTQRFGMNYRPRA